MNGTALLRVASKMERALPRVASSSRGLESLTGLLREAVTAKAGDTVVPRVDARDWCR